MEKMARLGAASGAHGDEATSSTAVAATLSATGDVASDVAAPDERQSLAASDVSASSLQRSYYLLHFDGDSPTHRMSFRVA